MNLNNYNFQFDNYTVLINAALRGDGVALCSSILAEDFLMRGELVRPLSTKLRSEYSFYTLRPKKHGLSSAGTKFHDWLLSKAGDQSRDLSLLESL